MVISISGVMVMRTLSLPLRSLYQRAVGWFSFAAIIVITMSVGGDHAQAASGQPGEKTRTQEKDSTNRSGGFIGNATRKLLEDHNAQLLGTRHTVTVLPIGYYDFRTGLNLGVFSRIQCKQDNPYLYRLTLQVMASHKGSHRHKIIFAYPEIGRSHFGFRLHGEWERDLEARYFGIGNDSLNDEDLTNSGSGNFIDKDFYIYNLKRPRILLYGTREIFGNVVFWFGFGLEQVKPQLKAGAETSFLGQDQPFGYLGGSGRNLSFRLIWDTRSDDLFPLKGFLTEFSFEPNFASVNLNVAGANGMNRTSRSVTFYRYTFSDAHFLPIRSDRLIFANRIAFEAVAGDAPYYALGEIASVRETHALGGSQSLRGFQSRRFHDKIKFFTLTELRYSYRSFRLFAQSFDVIFIGFFDTGRVWGRGSDIAFKDFHSTFGAGVWLNWNNRMIFRLDVGRSQEQLTPFFRLSTAF